MAILIHVNRFVDGESDPPTLDPDEPLSDAERDMLRLCDSEGIVDPHLAETLRVGAPRFVDAASGTDASDDDLVSAATRFLKLGGSQARVRDADDARAWCLYEAASWFCREEEGREEAARAAPASN